MISTWNRRLRAGSILVGVLVVVLALVLGIGSAAAESEAPVSAPHGVCPTQTTPLPLPFTLTVTLQRPNSPPPDPAWAVPVHLALYPPGDENTICHQWDLTLDQSGQWSDYLSMFTGTYDVRVKNMHTLRNVKRNVAIEGPITLDMGTLLEGDADDDNRVRSSDFALLRAAYFTQEGDAGFDPRTDFDEDNRIRSSDFALLRNNYFATGDIDVTSLGAQASAAFHTPTGKRGRGASSYKPQGSVALALEPASVQVAPGDFFTLTLTAHAGAQSFVAMDADIRFSPEFLQVVGADGQPATSIKSLAPMIGFFNQADNAAGRILYGAGLFTGAVSGDVAIAQVRFRAVQAVPQARIDLVDGTVSDPEGKFVTGSLSSAQAAIIPAGGFKQRYIPLLLR